MLTTLIFYIELLFICGKEQHHLLLIVYVVVVFLRSLSDTYCIIEQRVACCGAYRVYILLCLIFHSFCSDGVCRVPGVFFRQLCQRGCIPSVKIYKGEHTGDTITSGHQHERSLSRGVTDTSGHQKFF